LRRNLAAVAPATAALRITFGVGLLVRPHLLARFLGADSVTAGRTAWLTRMVAGRELALGVGTLTGSPGPWLVAQMISDSSDAFAIAAALRRRQVSRVLGAGFIAFAVGAVGLEAAALVDRAGARSRTG
jgi:hypothetical protein